MNQDTTQPCKKEPIHPSQAELTIISVDDWLHDKDDEVALKLKQDLDAKLIAADNSLNSQSHEQQQHRHSYRARGRSRGRGHYRGHSRGSYRGNSRSNTYDEYGNKTYSNKTSRGRARIYRRSDRGRDRDMDRGKGRDSGSGRYSHRKKDYFVQKRRKYESNRKSKKSEPPSSDYADKYKYSDYYETQRDATTGDKNIYTQKKAKPHRKPLDFSAVDQKREYNEYDWNEINENELDDADLYGDDGNSWPDAPNDLALNDMRRPAVKEAAHSGKKSGAYVSYCLPKDDAFIICCCTLGLRLKDFGCKMERVLMLPYECFDSRGKLIDVYSVFLSFWDVCIAINHSDVYPYYYCKVHAFSLIDYANVMFLEPYCIINDAHLERYYEEFEMIPCAPHSSNYGLGQSYQVMVIEPNNITFNSLYDSCYAHKKQKQLSCEGITELIASKYKWTAIANSDETDKDEWFLNVTRAQIEDGQCCESFVIAYFEDANPWQIYSEIGKEKACKCVAVRVWMESAWKLVNDVANIATLVNPEILKIIDPGYDNMELQMYENEESENMVSLPPQYYEIEREPLPQNRNENGNKSDKEENGHNDQEEDEEDEDDDFTDTEEEDNALKPRDIDDEDDD